MHAASFQLTKKHSSFDIIIKKNQPNHSAACFLPFDVIYVNNQALLEFFFLQNKEGTTNNKLVSNVVELKEGESLKGVLYGID